MHNLCENTKKMAVTAQFFTVFRQKQEINLTTEESIALYKIQTF